MAFVYSNSLRDHFDGLVVNYGISNTYVLEIPFLLQNQWFDDSFK